MNKNNYNFWKKAMVLAIIGLFLGAGVVPSISGNFREDGNDSIGLESIKDVSQDDSKTASSSQGVDWWTMFHHDPYHSGYSTSDAPETNNIKWSYTTGYIVYSSPAVCDGKVYIGSDNKVYCLDAATGDFIWSYTTGGPVWSSSPAVCDGKVYFGSFGGKVYCLDAATGDFIWSYTTGGPVWSSSPAVCDGKVYFGSLDDKVYCLDAATGDFIWSYTTGDWVYSSPAVADGKVFIGSKDNKVYCLDAATGDFIWSYTTGDDVRSSPAVADGKVYVGSWDKKVYCLDAETGNKIWSYTTGNYVSSSPAVADGKVYIGSGDAKVYCLNAETGNEIWSYTTGDWVVDSSPAVCDGKVYIGSLDSKVYCLDAATGDFIWSYTTGDWVYSSPAVADGKVYVGSWDDKVYCFEDSGNNPPNTPSKPFGATSVIVNHPHRYLTSAVDPDGDRVQYYFDWDDDGGGDWTGFVDSGENEGYDHIWRDPGAYQVKAKARDEHGTESDWSEPLTVTVEEEANHQPNKPNKPSGPESGKAGVEYTYFTSAVDPDGDQIKCYLWDWGDGEKSEIFGPFDSGEISNAEHVWKEEDYYEIKVWAQDANGAQSYPSYPLIVSMPKPKPCSNPLFWFFEQLLDRYPFLEESILNMYRGGR